MQTATDILIGFSVGFGVGVIAVYGAYRLARPKIIKEVGRAAREQIHTEAVRYTPGFEAWADLAGDLIAKSLEQGLQKGLP